MNDLKKLDRPIQVRSLAFMNDRLSALAGPAQHRRAFVRWQAEQLLEYRVGDWGRNCDIQDQRIVVRVLRVGNGREVYR